MEAVSGARNGKILVQVPEDLYSDPGFSLAPYRRQAADRAARMGGELTRALPEIGRVAEIQVELDGEMVTIPPVVNLIFSMVEVDRGGN